MKPPFRVLYSNDTTHIETCRSPYAPEPFDWLGRRAKPFGPAQIEASVDETAGLGIDVHLLQPGVGWVPWWRSRVYPFDEHVRYLRERFGLDPARSGFASYMAAGGDIVGVVVARCRQHGLAPFVSLRLNDSHGHEFLNAPPDEIPGWAWHTLTRTHVEHPEWRISNDLADWAGRVLNWAIPEVPASKYAFIEEICEQYDLDGFELDFMRHCRFFDEQRTSSAERRAVMLGFIRRVRALLDRTAAPGRQRWLCVRIPCRLDSFDALGIDPAAWAEAGVEMFNLSPSFFTEQQTDAAAIRRLVPEAGVYCEMAHTTHVGPNTSNEAAYDNFSYRRTTDLQYYTTAHLAYARGLDGLSTFNFVYYREHGFGERGPFCEPPWHIFGRLADRAWLARQPQHYILGEVWPHPPGPRPLPVTLAAGDSAAVSLDLAPPTGGWQRPGKLRIQSTTDLGDGMWSAVLNGTTLADEPDRSEPFANPYPALLGTAAQHRAWRVPPALLHDGVQRLEIRCLAAAQPAKLVFVDLALP